MASRTCATPVVPGAFPMVGHAWPLMRRPLRFAQSLSGHGDLVEVRLGPVRAQVPCDPELLWRVLTDDRLFDKGGPFFDRVRATIGNGVGACPYGEHRRQRRLIQPSFQPARLKGYAAVMEEEAAALTERWDDGGVIDAYRSLFGAALRSVLRTLFATRAGDAVVDRFRTSVETVLQQLTARMFVPAPLLRLPLPVNRRFDRAVADLRRGIDDLVAERRRDRTDRGDLLSALMTAQDDENGTGCGTGLTDTEIHDQVLTMLTAGSDSVTAAVSWALYLLDRNPEALDRLEREVDAVLAGRAARGDDVPALAHTGRVITEALRLYPPGWLFTRVTTAETELGGHRLPPGTTVAFCAPAVHRGRQLYDDPEEFDPDRWLPERARTLPRGAFTAFGGGARKCAGEAYALTECTLLLATIVSRWRLRPAPGCDVRPVALSTALRPRRLLMETSARRGLPK
ncbi:cytochrome P450 [Streptantibioticus cattleyicolor]|uniref:Cytochrome P450 n=1 Tax=Streptantibioticus cattleyicolor (strain ATCC 35852 / DSM 46488 / JCM 4925 / NBRC 14057 / NRRL 8057) TaxID=1003195 RepID=F8JK17_STREN|nr:cytochrome P450 [Streptantibioticus cattleyicolor]AEW99847.1 cytochrome P450 [Streptantibioticus cattleyicolor NRRL 8057 = DSM 46488]CCB71116.1 Pentalenene C13 hydroxylase; cytochrome P450 [Streptantibioticus cattleyicolor NRRL 8057 = DSM 46488]